MPIKNYTTKEPAQKSLQKIQDMLVSHGAVGIQMMYDGDRRISAISFALPFNDGRNLSFQLPCQWRRFQMVLKEQQIKRWEDDEYAYRVAWANLRDWVASQMALYETQMVTMPQIFLPFVEDGNGQTLFEKIAQNPNFLLGSGE
jgi:hypothetical protein